MVTSPETLIQPFTKANTGIPSWTGRRSNTPDLKTSHLSHLCQSHLTTGALESQERTSSSSFNQLWGHSTIAKTSQSGKFTTKEDANFQCRVCEKLFRRNCDLDTHMETHNGSREYPFPYLLKDCDKKYTRERDLQRHNRNFHMKQQNLRCDICLKYLARKDTLKRYVKCPLFLLF
jgi:hypothetical protein